MVRTACSTLSICGENSADVLFPRGEGCIHWSSTFCANGCADSRGVYHYLPLGHRLEAVRPDRLPSHLNSEMFLGQPYLANAAAVVQRSFAWLIYSMMVNQIHTIDPTVFKTEDDAPVIRLLQNSL